MRVSDGAEIASASLDYPHGVMDTVLTTPDGELRLLPNWALAHPMDWLEVLGTVVRRLLAESGIVPAQVIGIGIDSTTCTLLPTDERGEPLCVDPRHAGDPHAYAKLWKHHGAQSYADRMTEIARKRGEAFLSRYGGKVSSEWLFPKLWQTLDEAPGVYDAAHRFIDTADWIVMKLTGQEARSGCLAGYKAFWNKREGYPSNDYFAALDKRLGRAVDEKLSRDIRPVCTRAGVLTEEGAHLTGLLPGTAVAVGHSDAHVALPAAGRTLPRASAS